MFNSRELATLLAALLFWREEITPHSTAIAMPYFASLELPPIEPLSHHEIESLMQRLKRMLDSTSLGS